MRCPRWAKYFTRKTIFQFYQLPLHFYINLSRRWSVHTWLISLRHCNKLKELINCKKGTPVRQNLIETKNKEKHRNFTITQNNTGTTND